MYMMEYQDLLDSKKPHCPCCGKDVTGAIIDFYNHEYGWPVDGYQSPLWLSVHCEHCNYDISLNKVGILRPGWDMDSEQLKELSKRIEDSGNSRYETEPFTAEDAFKRITVAKVGSLWQGRLTEEYLIALRRGIHKWLEEVDEALACWSPEPELDESMDGDHASALASAGFGTDEDYGSFGCDEDF